MRSRLVAVVLGFAAFGTVPSPAAPYTPAFNDSALRLELETRLDNDFGGILTATEKKQLKAVLKCLALMDRPSGGALRDLKTFSTVARLLEKAYPVELAAGFDSDFYTTIMLSLASVSEEFGNDYSALYEAVGKLAPSPHYTKSSRLRDEVQETLDQAYQGGSPSALGKATIKAWRLALKGLAIAAEGEVLPAPSVDFTVDALPLTAGTVYWTYHSVSQRVVLNTSATDPATGDSHSLGFEFAADSLGVASQVLSGFYARHTEALGDESFAITAGTTTVTSLDLVGHLCEGSFDLTTDGGHSVSGTFTATWNLTVESMGD